MSDAKAVIAELRKKLESRYKDTEGLFPDYSKKSRIEVVPSSSVILNAVTGIGGFPRGRVTEVFGGFSTGKTTIATQLVAELHRHDPASVALYLDYEHAFDMVYAKKLGVDMSPDRFVFVQPETFEQGHTILDEYLNAGVIDLVIVDSAAAMTPQQELEGDADATTRLGLQASLMARLLSRVTKQLKLGKKPAMVVLNQTRAVIDIANPRNSGVDAAGGSAMKFYTSIRLKLEIQRSEGESKRGTKGTDQVFTRSWIRVTASKNKLAPPFMRGLLAIDYGKGVNNVASVAELAESKLGLMSGAGFFKYESKTPANSFSLRGREALIQLLEQRPEVLVELEQKIAKAMEEDMLKETGIVLKDASVAPAHGGLVITEG